MAVNSIWNNMSTRYAFTSILSFLNIYSDKSLNGHFELDILVVNYNYVVYHPFLSFLRPLLQAISKAK